MRRKLRELLARIHKALQPPPDRNDYEQRINHLTERMEAMAEQNPELRRNLDYLNELVEARQMFGAGPWGPSASRPEVALQEVVKLVGLRESDPPLSAGAYGDIELALQNVEWRRQVNISWLEFSRWGIQQIILISRLYWVKHPVIRRLINIAAFYVFARGFEVSSPDEAANEVIADFLEDNRTVLGQSAMTENHKRRFYDGNIFFALFSDTADTGKTKVRLIDAVEVDEIVSNPNDSDEPWLYLRRWTECIFDERTGETSNVARNAWYPALGYDPAAKPEKIREYPVMWNTHVYHRKYGAVAKWKFGCPEIYPALDWARESRRFLEACASVKQSLAQVAMTLTTKGGQQAIEGAKQQLGTTVGPTSSLLDQNPPSTGNIFVSGTGTKLDVMKTSGAGGNPEEVRRYLLFCCMVVGVPETFLGDVSTGNLATATTLDRPTELCFLEQQEAWREDLVILTRYALEVSAGAPSGKIRESHGEGVTIRECPRRRTSTGATIYEAKRPKKPKVIEISCTFPTIREGDQKLLMDALVEAATLNNKGGQFVGIDEKEFVRRAYEILGIDKGDEIAEAQYPDKDYDPNRSQQELTAPIQKLAPQKGGTQIDPTTHQDSADQPASDNPGKTEEALRDLHEVLNGRFNGRR